MNTFTRKDQAGVGTGGTTGQVYTKNSNADFDADWADSSGSQDLQSVTDVGNTTTNSISVGTSSAPTAIIHSVGGTFNTGFKASSSSTSGIGIALESLVTGGHKYVLNSTGTVASPIANTAANQLMVADSITTLRVRGNSLTLPTAGTILPTVITGTTAPGTTPSFVGQFFLDTANKKLYVATGTSSSSDWTVLN